MTRTAVIAINNCTEKNGYEVARIVKGEFWHYGIYDTYDKAKEVAEELGETAVIARLSDG